MLGCTSAFRPFDFLANETSKTAVWKDSSLQSHPDECFIHRFHLSGRGLLGRWSFVRRMPRRVVWTLGKKKKNPKKRWRKYLGVCSKQSNINDSRRVAAGKIYTGLTLLSQAGLVKVELPISLVKAAKRALGSNWSFEGCRWSLWGECYKEQTGS